MSAVLSLYLSFLTSDTICVALRWTFSSRSISRLKSTDYSDDVSSGLGLIYDVNIFFFLNVSLSMNLKAIDSGL